MSVAKLIKQILRFNRPAFYADHGYAGYHQPPLRGATNKRWLLGVGAAAGAMLLAAFAGHGMRLQPDQEIAWLNRLASTGDAGAQLQLGLAYRDGRYGLAPDAKTGLYWLTQAAANGQSYAADLVGTAYAEGQGTPRDMATARHWWNIAAKDGNAHAAQRLGEQLASTDPVSADQWLERAAAQGDKQAEQDLRGLYSRNAAPASDLQLGKSPLNVVANQIDSPTLKTLAGAWNLLTLPATAMQTSDALRQSAQAGDPTAEFQLGMRYRDGAWSVNRDPAQAEYWLQRAAADGNHLAVQALADEHHG